MKGSKVFKLILLLIVIIILFATWKFFGPAVSNPDKKYLFIKTGSGYEDVKNDLIDSKLLNSTFWFNTAASIMHYKTVKPGRFKIDQGTSLVSMIRMLKNGRQSAVKLVITRLRTKEDLARKIGLNFEPDSAAVSLFLNTPDSIAKYHLDTNTVMTAIIPDTYTILWNTSFPKIFRTLKIAEERFWNATRKGQAANLHLSPDKVYILASIVEEETNMEQDKGKVASVYMNRLNSGMRLAADPTVKFALKQFALKRIMNKQTQFNSPYNTYTTSGLPPGPICTPSMKTIDAVLNAPATPYLFFVAKPDRSGYSNFVSSYEEHRKYATIYQHWLDSLFTSRHLNKDGSTGN